MPLPAAVTAATFCADASAFGFTLLSFPEPLRLQGGMLVQVRGVINPDERVSPGEPAHAFTYLPRETV